ncbi:MAG: translation initiation factor IF-2 [Desulfovibrio sp.]|jgi:translation initiation factor IF-2|nr:translation initiation factor IF-2 [Desulfovibrio sp.]
MPEEKCKIKDIAVELEVQPKEMLRALREIGLPAKSTAGSISREDVTRVRDYFSAHKHQNIERTEIRNDIIVRRHRGRQNQGAEIDGAGQVKTDALPSAVTLESGSDLTPPREPDKPDLQGDSRERTRKTPSDAGATISSTPMPDAEKNGKKTRQRPSRSKSAEAPPSPARVISRPKTGEAEISAPEATSGEIAPVTEVIPATPGEAQGKSPKSLRLTLPDASAIPDAVSAPALSTRARELDTRNSPAAGNESRSGAVAPARRISQQAPRVKIISRPDPTEQERRIGQAAGGRSPAQHDAGARPDNKRGQRIGRPAQQDSQRASALGQPAVTAPTDNRDGQSKKKRLKGRRTVDFQQNAFEHRRENDDTHRLNRGKIRRKNVRPAPQPMQQTQPIKAAKRKIRIDEAIRVADMAHQMGLKVNEIIKILFGLGIMATINQSLDIDTAILVAAEFDYEVEKVGLTLKIPDPEFDPPESLKSRPPVVTIMGHVDHGKTSLLDAIRKSNVTSGEAGGITQHIGAYHVRTKRGEIVFLDTPGHEAFTAMRARGAQITDLVILVVAADDGVMEQTREAINHARAANVPIMVAVNKMDKPGADPDRVLRELAELGLQPEDWGGDTIVARVSAKTRSGLDELLEMVALQSEIMELKANPDKLARGRIVEARLDKGRGPIATVLIQQGTLKQGDNFVCGAFSGRVRALTNEQGKKVKSAGPSLPLEVQGFEGVPDAGEEFIVLEDEKLARRIADSLATKQRERDLASESRVTLETFLSRRASGQEALTLNLVVKADVQGSLEAIAEALNKESTDKVRLQIMHGGAGAISESDVMLASASKAIIIGFNVRPTAKVKETAERENVDIRFYNIIYKLVEDIKNAMVGMLAPVQREVYLGQAEVRKTYNVPKAGMIAGSYVADGKIARNAGARLLRDGVVIYTGKIESLKRFKDDAREVVKGNECGVGLENFNDIKEGDIIEAFETVEEAASL